MNLSWLPSYQKSIEDTIYSVFRQRYSFSTDYIEKEFFEAMEYAVSGGGKRLRPIFSVITYEYLTKSEIPKPFLEAIIGIEMIHAYTLVHDDLPCMDNDELRRGKPTVWKKYNETLAVLVGDGLQAFGFELLSRGQNISLLAEIARDVGDLGTVRGQARDMFLDQKNISLDELFRLHDEKTGGLIASSFSAGARLAGAQEVTIEIFRKFGMLLGRAFQLQDDILDFEGNADQLGKKVGKDVELGKGIVAKIGIESSKKLLSDMEKELFSLLKKENISEKKLEDMILFVTHRSI